MNEPTDWISALAILAAGLALGALFIFFFNKRKAKAKLGDESDLVRKDLEAKRDALIQQLRDLDEHASPEERARLERDTADVLRKLDAQPARATAATAATPAPAATSGMNPTVKGFLWGAGSVAALAGLFYFVMQASTPRQDGATITGNTPMQAAPQQPQRPDPMVQQLEAAVQRDPENLALRNDLAQAYLERENLMAVFEQTKFVLDRKPEDARALTYAALVRMAMGEGAEATKMLERASKSDPKNLDTWVALAWMHAQNNEMPKAEAMIAEAIKHSPENKARLEDVLRQMKQAATQPQQQAPVQSASGELPAGHPPIDGAPAPAPAAAAPSGPSVNVTLDLDPSARSKTGVLFVVARNPAGGPPAAVKRLQGVSFPITITLSSADSMLGQPLPAKFRLEARLDSDGNATTKPPTDPSAMQNDVTPGATVTLALK
ncbi:MAG TPA: tetratricopeptide repeat protein [Thermoanaerobaculia bacterium]|jgi:tetratricopeptide (TPR) repeat protein|nr:tetratricopeptide repeat protein [Thermoanaerobaculia bacterium]